MDKMAEEHKSRLGRGLAALIGDVGNMAAENTAQKANKAPIEFLRPNPRNPRQKFRDEDLQELAESIRERGIVQPIIVRELAGVEKVYEIIAGERRWRAAQIVGLHEVPVVIVEADDQQSLEIAIIENVQRADLNAIEEAQGYQRLIDEFAYQQGDLARIIGKSRSQVSNTLRLLRLPAETREYVVNGEISAGHARALLAVADPTAMAKRIVEEGLTVRDIEKLAQEKEEVVETKVKLIKVKDADTLALEKLLSDLLGLSVKINHKNDAGQIQIQYKSMDQLDSLCKRLQG